MLFTLEVNKNRYSVYGVIYKNIRVIRNPFNNGLGTQIIFYLFDGSTLYNYNLLFTRKLTDNELQHLFANSVNKELTTTIPCKDTLMKLQVVSNTTDYCVLHYGLMRYVVTRVDYNNDRLNLYLFDSKIATIILTSETSELYNNNELLDLAGKSRNSVETVVQQLFKRLVRLDNNIHELRLDYLERYNIKYEVIIE